MPAKTVYSYDPKTGIFAGETTAFQSPLDKNVVWLMPANSTEEAPPEASGNQSAVYAAGAWTLVPDFRGIPLWSTATAQPVCAELGDTLDSLAATPLPPPPFGVWSKDKWSVGPGALTAAVQSQLQILQFACQSAITAGFISSALGKPNHYGSLQTDQINLQIQFAASQSSNPPSAYYIYCSPAQMQNPPLVQHTQAQMLQVLADLNAWRTAQQQQYSTLVQQVQAAKTVAAVQAVNWN